MVNDLRSSQRMAMGNQEQRSPQRLPPRHVFTPADQFDFDRSKVPDDVKYQWVATTILGQDARRLPLFQRNGWTFVPAGRHPEITGADPASDARIEVAGQVLMQLPKQYWDEATAEDKAKAQHTLANAWAMTNKVGRTAGGARGGVRQDSGPMRGEVIE